MGTNLKTSAESLTPTFTRIHQGLASIGLATWIPLRPWSTIEFERDGGAWRVFGL